MESPSSKHPPGQTFGPYRILSHVASGGMGEVYLAEDERLGRKVVLKILPELFSSEWVIYLTVDPRLEPTQVRSAFSKPHAANGLTVKQF